MRIFQVLKYKNPHYVAKLTGVSLVSSYKLIVDFVRLGILQEQTGYRRNRVFVFREYLNLFERKK